MREPQLVRTPAVQKMSLWAMGMPVSGPASPAAMAHRPHRRVGGDGDVAVQLPVMALDTSQAILGQRAARYLPGSQPLAEFGNSRACVAHQPGYSITRGTR
jgi:hypothetical protein